MRARLILEPEHNEVIPPDARVLIAEVVSVEWTLAGKVDAVYLESMTKGGAERRLQRPPVGWPIIVYARQEQAAEIASPGG